jgi:hypothetical protein
VGLSVPQPVGNLWAASAIAQLWMLPAAFSASRSTAAAHAVCLQCNAKCTALCGESAPDIIAHLKLSAPTSRGAGSGAYLVALRSWNSNSAWTVSSSFLCVTGSKLTAYNHFSCHGSAVP